MDKFDVLTLLPSRPTINVVDVGAMFLGANLAPYAKLMAAGIAKVVGFEPVQEECDKLNRLADPACTYLPYVIGDGGRRTFHLCNMPMTSSLYEPNTELLAKFQHLENLTRVVKRTEVQTHRLDDLEEVRSADFLKIDVQGAELDVLKGAERMLSDAVLVHTEVEFVPMYRNQPLFAEVDQHLRSRGYLFHKFIGVAGRTFKPLVTDLDLEKMRSQVLWGDVVYVRDFMALDRLSPQKLVNLAVILHMQYGSVDLALESLKAHDAKTGAGLAPAYLRRLMERK
jgi:FkbM family methyltransferase